MPKQLNASRAHSAGHLQPASREHLLRQHDASLVQHCVAEQLNRVHENAGHEFAPGPPSREPIHAEICIDGLAEKSYFSGPQNKRLHNVKLTRRELVERALEVSGYTLPDFINHAIDAAATAAVSRAANAPSTTFSALHCRLEPVMRDLEAQGVTITPSLVRRRYGELTGDFSLAFRVVKSWLDKVRARQCEPVLDSMKG